MGVGGDELAQSLHELGELRLLLVDGFLFQPSAAATPPTSSTCLLGRLRLSAGDVRFLLFTV